MIKLVSDSEDRVIQLLTGFDLTPDESRVYSYLYKSGQKTALQLSRELEFARTKIYRMIENLTDIGLVIELVGDKGKIFKAASKSQFESILKQKDLELGNLKNSTVSLFETLDSLRFESEGLSEVRHYRGIEGLKQMTWNSLKAKEKLLIFEIKDMSAFLDYGFAEKVRMEFVNRKLKVRELTNQRRLGPWTDIQPFVEKFWDCRFIRPKLLKLDIEMLIYNDIYALYGYDKDEIFGVEIRNKHLANMQKQIFNSFWSRGKEMEIGKSGRARVRK